MDASDIVEEDEEAFLKGSGQGFSSRKTRVIQDDVLAFKDDDLEPIKPLKEDMSLEVDEQWKDSCRSAEPMKEDISLNQPAEWVPPFCPEIYPLDQQDWEERIIWDNSPALSDNAAESSEISGPDPEGSVNEQSDLDSGQEKIHPTVQMEPDEKDHGLFLHSCPVSVEPFGSRKLSTVSDFPSENRYHPQLLRLESRLEIEGPDYSDAMKDGAAEKICPSDAIRRFSKLNLQNRDVLEGSWLDKIIWDPHQSIAQSKLILDLQDEQMLFEILDDKDGRHLQVHAGAMIITRSVKSNGGDSVELHSHGGPSGGRFNIANDKFYSNRKSSQQLKSHSKKRTAHGVKVLHSIPALKLQTMKAKLSK